MVTGFGFDKKNAVITPPNKMPPAKKRFHISFFQSYLKNEIFIGAQEAHMCRNDEEIPKDLFPKISKAGTVSPIKGPATYQGQGCFIHSIKLITLNFFVNTKLKRYRLLIVTGITDYEAAHAFIK